MRRERDAQERVEARLADERVRVGVARGQRYNGKVYPFSKKCLPKRCACAREREKQKEATRANSHAHSGGEIKTKTKSRR